MTDDLEMSEKIARIGRELADAEHKRVMALDVPKGAQARALATGAAIFGAGGTFVAAIVGALALLFKMLGTI